MKAAFLTVAFLLTSASLVLSQNQSYTPDPAWKAPADAAARKNPAKSAESAKKVYDESCAGCHGANGVPSLKTAPNLHEGQALDQSDGALEWKITTGNPKHGMPPFKRLPEQQRWQLVSYIRTLAKAK
jgi:mono/diheme cytochrome c family protein